MLPLSDKNSSPHHHDQPLRHQSFKKTKASSVPYHSPLIIADQDPITTPISVLSFSSLSCLIVLILFLQTLFIIFSNYLPFSLHSNRRHHHHHHHHHHLPSLATTSPTPSPDQCELGKIFVYDLPPIFNTEISRNCDKLNPWNSRCEALSNDGFGRPATALSRILPADLLHAWFWTDQFATELIFHSRILHHRCRTLDPDSAAAYYVPFYAGLAVGRHLWPGADDHSTVKDRDRDCEMLSEWIRHRSPFFNRSNGWDHFITMGRISWDFRRLGDAEWGSRCIYTPAMGNVTRLLIERNPWDYFDVGIPYPTGFHPGTDADVVRWQEFVRSRHRRTLFCFAGAGRGSIRNDFRGILLGQCGKESGSCRVVDCAGDRCLNGASEVLETFLDSEFCLQPRGDSFTRRSIFDCLVAGSIPVFFWKRTAYMQYQWFLPGEPGSYSVFIHRDEVKNGTSIRRVLEGYDKEKVREMREKVIESIPRLVYSKPNEGLQSTRDAFDVAVDGVLRRIKLHKNKGYKWK